MERNRVNPSNILSMSVADACKTVGIGRTRLYSLIGEGRITAVRCGGKTLILADSLRTFVTSLPPASIRVTKPASIPIAA